MREALVHVVRSNVHETDTERASKRTPHQLLLLGPATLGLATLGLATLAIVGCNRSGSSHEQAVASAAATENRGAAAATKYTCPMHAEVVSDKPGPCPKCGMDLVPADQHKGHDLGQNH
jgi:hypothetical protein